MKGKKIYDSNVFRKKLNRTFNATRFLKKRKNSKEQKPDIEPHVIPPETPPAKPEKKTEPEKNNPFLTPPEVKPIHEPKTYPSKKEK